MEASLTLEDFRSDNRIDLDDDQLEFVRGYVEGEDRISVNQMLAEIIRLGQTGMNSAKTVRRKTEAGVYDGGALSWMPVEDRESLSDDVLAEEVRRHRAEKMEHADQMERAGAKHVARAYRIASMLAKVDQGREIMELRQSLKAVGAQLKEASQIVSKSARI